MISEPAAMRTRLAAELTRGRRRTAQLTAAVDDDDLVRQHSPLMSPLVWDLAHIGNQEELWLVRDVGGREPVRCDIDEMYDAFRHSRRDRPRLPLLPPAQARAYVAQVREKVFDILDAVPLQRGAPGTVPVPGRDAVAGGRSGGRAVDPGFTFGMIVQHEQQHAETMLATHQLRLGSPVLAAPPPPPARVAVAGEVLVPGGPFTMGTSTDPWALDNERPAHRVEVPAFVIEAALVSNARYAEFIADGGYDDQRWWSSAGWAHRVAARLSAPAHWRPDGAGWAYRQFGRISPIVPDEPVVHVCHYEAEAFASWAGKRLPTEVEWEKAARWDPAGDRSRRYPWGDDEPTVAHANLGQRHLAPAPAGAYPAGASALGVYQLLGDVWEWTSSELRPYPGFHAFPYREYSEVFFGPEYRILRGGSFGTDRAACRGTFRNWDYPVRRQIFSGFRCARDVRPDEVAEPAGAAG